MISLLYPFVLAVGLVLSLMALVAGRKRVAILVLMLVLALDVYSQCIPLRLYNKSLSSAADGFSVLTLNVHGGSDSYTPNELNFATMILDQDPDFIILTEYYQKNCSDTLHNRIVAAGYNCITRIWSSGNALYSKNGAKQTLLKLTPSSTGSVTSIEASASGKEFNMFFCHLSSNNYDSSKRNYSTPDNIKNLDGLKFYLNRIEAASKVRLQEVNYLLERVEASDLPTIILGDMNDVGGSPAMNALRKHGFKDAWWKGGSGYGATIHDPLPFRIDHVMYNDKLQLAGIKKIGTKGMSDHDALVARFVVR